MSESAETYRAEPPRAGGTSWDGARVRRLREHLGETQAELAARLGTRQQTVSEWETGTSRPRRMSGRLLQLVAEEAGFYGVASDEPAAAGEDDVLGGAADARGGEGRDGGEHRQHGDGRE